MVALLVGFVSFLPLERVPNGDEFPSPPPCFGQFRLFLCELRDMSSSPDTSVSASYLSGTNGPEFTGGR